MKLKDIKTLITSGTIIMAVALYMIFSEPADEKASTNSSTDNTALETIPNTSTSQDDAQTYVITPELAEQETGNELIDVEFISANDGDTMNVKMDGEKQRVRLLMIDTPEMNYNKGEPMPYAEQAKEFTTNLMNDAENVQLLFDVGPEIDNYDRLLAYVFVDGVSLHELLLNEGLAAVRYVNKPNNTLESQLRNIQAQAEEERINIWAHENYFQKDGFHADEITN